MSDPRGLNQDMHFVANSNLEITPLNGSFNIIQQLDDEPNDVGGLSAAELKAKFDQAGLAIQTYINETLIPEVLGAASTEAQRETNEETRQAQETQRQANETARQTQEAAREAGAAALSQELTVHAQTLEAELRETEAELEAQIEAREQALEVWEAYDAQKAYVPGNKVSFQGSSYVNKSGCTGVAPTGPTAAEQEAGAEHWLMIAAKGRDGTGDLTTDAADGRYIRQAGGDMAGPLTVLDPTEEAHAVPKRYVDRKSAFCKTFAAADWSSDGTISIPRSEHGKTFPGSVVILDAYMLVDGSYVKTWATQATYAKVERDRTLTLIYPDAANGAGGYAGKVIVVG